jgi:putative phage-type endonuclease
MASRVLSMNQVEQGSPEWHAAREVLLTASSCAAALSIPFSKRQTPQAARAELMREKKRQAFRRMSGLPQVSRDSAAMKHGRDNEDVARKILEERLGESVHEVGLVIHPEHDWLGASLDGVTDSGRLVEIKCPSSRDIVPGEVPEHYMPQLQVGMEVTGLEEAVFVQYKPRASMWPEPDSPEVFETVIVPRDREWFARSLPLLESFHREMMEPLREEEIRELSKPPRACRKRARPLCGGWIPVALKGARPGPGEPQRVPQDANEDVTGPIREPSGAQAEGV